MPIIIRQYLDGKVLVTEYDTGTITRDYNDSQYDFVLSQWVSGLYMESDVLNALNIGCITQEEYNTILATERMV